MYPSPSHQTVIILYIGLQSAEIAYRDKTNGGNAKPKTLFELGWKVEEFSTLLSNCRQLLVEVNVILDTFKDSDSDHVVLNTARNVTSLRTKLSVFVKNISRQRRTSASHIFVFMVSCERRDVKPYSIPIQCVPYRNLRVSTMRRLVSTIVKEMTARGMKVAGRYNQCYCLYSVNQTVFVSCRIYKQWGI